MLAKYTCFTVVSGQYQQLLFVLRTRVIRKQVAVMSRPSHQASALFVEHRSVAERTMATRGHVTLTVQAALMTLESRDHLVNEAQILTAVHTHTAITVL